MSNNKNNCIVLKVDDETRDKMLKFYKDNDRGKKIPYVSMQAVNEDVVITIYDKNKKGENKVMFQGTSADVEASVWAMEETAIETSFDCNKSSSNFSLSQYTIVSLFSNLTSILK